MKRKTPKKAIVIVVLVLLGASGRAAAQEPFCGVEPDADAALVASPLLPRDHWAARALERAHGLGLLPEYHPAQRSVPRAEAVRHLRAASARAAESDAEIAALARAWCERIVEEFPELGAGGGADRGWRASGVIEVGYVHHEGRAAPGTGYRPGGRRFSGAVPLADLEGPVFGASVVAVTPGNLGFMAEPTWDDDEFTLSTWTLSVPLGPIGVSIGREPVAYGAAESGAVTLSGIAPIAGVQAFTREPFRLPGFLRYLGHVSAHTVAGRIDEPRHPGAPWFWGAYLALQPHPRLSMAGNRVAVFGGDSVGVPITPRTLWRLLIGETASSSTNSFENQSASVEIRWRPPTERVIPLLLYVEAGMEDFDVKRGLRDAPGVVAGVSTPAVPFFPQLQLGIERSYFADACCGNGIWYRHFGQTGGWAVEEGPLGHPLGGHGSQTLVFARADLNEARLRLALHAFRRDRGHQNLYAPGREGRSHGATLKLHWRVGPRTEFSLHAHREDGVGWDEQRLETGLSIRY